MVRLFGDDHADALAAQRPGRRERAALRAVENENRFHQLDGADVQAHFQTRAIAQDVRSIARQM
jgi:hypothetical protein